jgi:hypothetical protein
MQFIRQDRRLRTGCNFLVVPVEIRERSASVNAPRLKTLAAAGRALRRSSRPTALILVFGVALWGAARVVKIFLPPIKLPVIDEKLAHFAAHKDEYDTLFFGSSRTYRHLLPGQFDAATAAAGMPTKSFNFGIDGMFPPEDGYVLEQLFALKPRNLKRIFIEISFPRNHWSGMDPESTRALHWHDGPRMLQLASEEFRRYAPRRLAYPPQQNASRKPRSWRKAISDSPREAGKWWRAMSEKQNGLSGQIGKFSVHVGLFFRRTLGIGQVGEFVARYSKAFNSRQPPTARLVESNGLGPNGDGAVPVQWMETAEPSFLEKFERCKAERLAAPAPLRSLSKGHEADVVGMIALARRHGVKPILYISPEVVPCRRYPETETQVALFDFTDIAKYPELFQTELRIDISHMNDVGAKLFTEAFARRFLEHENGGW